MSGKGTGHIFDACGRILHQRSDILMLVAGGAMTENVVPAVARYRQNVGEAMENILIAGI